MSPGSLKRFQLLAELEEDEGEAIAEELEAVDLPAGVELFGEGEQAEGLCFVASGGLRLESTQPGAAVVEVGPGAALGGLSLVTGGARAVRAVTMAPTRVLVLRRSSFQRFADMQPRAACRLLEAILRDAARIGREALLLLQESAGAVGVDPVRSDH